MSNFILDNLVELAKRHYIRRASTQDFWLDLRDKRIASYHSQYGESFCLVIYGSQDQDDAYVIPYAEVKPLLDPNHRDSRGRWMGSISGDILSIRRSNRSLAVAAFYNAFELLQDNEPLDEGFTHPSLSGHFEITPDALRLKIATFNRIYRDSSPRRRRVVSEQIARHGALSEHIKQLRCYVCQICGQEGFRKKNGIPFAETHHIVELHKLIPGSYCSDNIVVVCATCHRKLHYASTSYSALEGGRISITINGDLYMFERNVISDEETPPTRRAKDALDRAGIEDAE